MLGSVHDAEDALQEALLRAWRGLARFEGRSSLRSWLYAIATNASLDAIERRPRRVIPIDHPPADPRDGPGEPLAESVCIHLHLPEKDVRRNASGGARLATKARRRAGDPPLLPVGMLEQPASRATIAAASRQPLQQAAGCMVATSRTKAARGSRPSASNADHDVALGEDRA